jgi:hypothetical protein
MLATSNRLARSRPAREISTLPRFAGGTVTLFVARQDGNTYVAAAVAGGIGNKPSLAGVHPT